MAIDSLSDGRKIDTVKSLIQRVMLSGQYTEGKVVALAEQRITNMYDHPSLVFNSGGAALYTVYRWLKSKGHERVVMQNNTFYATLSMAAEAGLHPVICDTSEMDPNMSIDSMRLAVELSGATVVCLSHIGGWRAQHYEAIAEWCTSHKVLLIEDAAHAFGLQMIGEYSEGAIFSFYPTKAIPAGEGGALVTKNSELFEFAKRFRNYGKSLEDGRMLYEQGFNFRMSEFDAAILAVQVEATPEILANRYISALALDEAGFSCLMGPVNLDSNYHKYPVSSRVGLKTVGKMYSGTDQLNEANTWYEMSLPVPLGNSKGWAAQHMCLPMGEHLYDGMSVKEIRDWLEVKE